MKWALDDLRHIWGDATWKWFSFWYFRTTQLIMVCQHIHIIALVPVEMTMNYMDYTDDRGMYMFTDGQKQE
jgi:hypothetical protein